LSKLCSVFPSFPQDSKALIFQVVESVVIICQKTRQQSFDFPSFRKSCKYLQKTLEGKALTLGVLRVLVVFAKLPCLKNFQVNFFKKQITKL